MKVLVTGGAGFIGRWVVKRLLEEGHRVWVLDNLSNGRKENLEEFLHRENLEKFVIGDIKDQKLLGELFQNKYEICYHLAASINVQDSLDDPETTFNNDVLGTFNVLEECRKHKTKMVFMSTCMVYDRAYSESGITELHPVKPASPYAGSKISGESLVLSYWHGYRLPVVVIRPFNTYGPFQKTGGEGGVVAIFIKRNLEGKTLDIYGDGRQTRDLLYVEDCARFVVEAGYQDIVNGEVLNAGTGRDLSINQLAERIADTEEQITHIPHIHPQSEIQKLLCDYSKTKALMGWKPEIPLEEGIKKTEAWIKNHLKLV